MKPGKKGYSRLLILSSRIVFLTASLRYLCGLTWSRNFKVLFLEWSSARRSIQGFLFWIWELFFKFHSQNTLFGKFGLGASKYFIWNETCYKGVFGGADSEIDNSLLSSVSKAFSFLEKVCPETWKLYVLNETKSNEIFKSANSRYNFSTLFFS